MHMQQEMVMHTPLIENTHKKMQSAAAFAFCFSMLFARVANSDDKSPRDASASRFPVLAGIGVALKITDDGPQISKLVPGSVAEKSEKIHSGDRILTIRSGDVTVQLKGKKMGDVVSLLRGPVGSTITLEIVPANSKSTSLVTLKREAVSMSGFYRTSTYDNLIGTIPPVAQFATLDRSSRITLSDYAGQVVVVDFWASWCGTCYAPVDKMQEIARSHPEWKNRVALVTATIDSDLQAASKVVKTRQWKETIHLSLPPEKLETMNIMTVPTVLILSPDGKIMAAGDPHAIEIEKEVLKLLPPTNTERRDKKT
jgi:thiol-disulfide isomerase/thioredoxin